MKNIKTSTKVLISTSLIGIMTALTAVSFASHISDASEVSFTFTASTKYNVTFYTSYSSGWGGTTVKQVSSGNTITAENIPSITPGEGYSFVGWINSVPTADNYKSNVLSSSELANVVVSDNASYYPIIKSNSELVYANSQYFSLGSDVVISSSSLSTTFVGYAYKGITGVQDISADWTSERILTSESGVYQFRKEGEGTIQGAYLYRKVGLSLEGDTSGCWKMDDNETTYGRGVDARIAGSGSTTHYGLTRHNETNKFYVYLPYQFTEYWFKNYDHKDGSGDAYSGSICITSSGGYSSTNWVLSKTGHYLSTWNIDNNQASWGEWNEN